MIKIGNNRRFIKSLTRSKKDKDGYLHQSMETFKERSDRTVRTLRNFFPSKENDEYNLSDDSDDESERSSRRLFDDSNLTKIMASLKLMSKDRK